jgi:hypothetical protein
MQVSCHLRLLETPVLNPRQSLTHQLKPYVLYLSGDILAELLLIKGVAGRAERRGEAPFFGEDGEALEKALRALGWPEDCWCGILLAPPSLQSLRPEGLRLLCETVDPRVIVALDEVARCALIEAFAPVEPKLSATLAPGGQTLVLGRRLISVDGFEEALIAGAEGDASAKQRVWAQLKQATPDQV